MNKYDKYKPTHINWLNDIPLQWQENRLRVYIDSELNGIWGSEEKGDSNDVICIRVADYDREFNNLSKENNTIRNIKPDDIRKRGLRYGDLLIEKSGGGELTPVGRVGFFDWEDIIAVCSNFMARLRLRSDCDPKFFFYLFKVLYHIRLNTKSIKQTTGIQNLDTYSYFSERVAVPVNKIEQTAIADYLDEKTAKIDSLIEKKKKLIELLKEERAAIINRAVTRGIDPDVKLKPSGIEWLGEIPENWEVKKLKYVAKFKSGESITSNNIRESDEFAVYGGNGLRGYTSSYTHTGEYILIGRQGALCGNINYASGKFFASEHAVVVTGFGNENILWLGELLNLMNLNQYSISAAQPGLSVERIHNLYIPYPPLVEQNEIGGYINTELNRIDNAVLKIRKEIELLYEYKTVLISEIVSGKICIRDTV